MEITYTQYRQARQKSFDDLPVKFAFGREQFDEMLEEFGCGVEDLYSLGFGGYYRKADADEIRAWLKSNDALDDLMKDYEFAKDAFKEEMNNHEYWINQYQGDWDVMSCFIEIEFKDEDYEAYLARSGWDEQTKQAYRDARMETYRQWCEEGWF